MKSCIYYIYINSVRGIGRDFHRFSGPFCFFDDIMSLRREKRRFTNRKRIFSVWNEATKTEMWMKKREEKCNTARFHCMRCVLLKIAIFFFVHVPSVFFHHPLCLYFMNVPHHTREHDSLVAATTSTALYATAAAPLLLSLALSLSILFSSHSKHISYEMRLWCGQSRWFCHLSFVLVSLSLCISYFVFQSYKYGSCTLYGCHSVLYK